MAGTRAILISFINAIRQYAKSYTCLTLSSQSRYILKYINQATHL